MPDVTLTYTVPEAYAPAVNSYVLEAMKAAFRENLTAGLTQQLEPLVDQALTTWAAENGIAITEETVPNATA